MTHTIIVGNIGTVYTGNVREFAEGAYRDYVQQSCTGMGRASGEQVTWMIDGGIHKEFDPKTIDPIKVLQDLTRLAKTINAVQHAGCKISDDAWSKLYQLTSTAEMVLADMVLKEALQGD